MIREIRISGNPRVFQLISSERFLNMLAFNGIRWTEKKNSHQADSEALNMYIQIARYRPNVRYGLAIIFNHKSRQLTVSSA